MKTIYIKVEVLDDSNVETLIADLQYGYADETSIQFTEITLPKGAEIQYESYNFETFSSVVLNPSYCFRRGANWAINKMKGE